MVELRKRPAPAAVPPPKAKKAATTKSKAGASKKSDAAKETRPPASNPTDDPTGGIPEGAGGTSATAEITSSDVAKDVAAKVEAAATKAAGPAVSKAKAAAVTVGSQLVPAKKGDTITIDGFGGEVETNEGEKTSLARLLENSKAGVIVFTYPKASTAGCTTQVCLFRDAYEPLTSTGFSIYGLSADSPKANTTFKTKQSLPYPLLCDPKQTLITAIGLKKAGKGSGTTRGVFVVDKEGKVLAAEPGNPQQTVDVVKGIIKEMGGDPDAAGVEKAEERAAEAGAEGDDAAMVDA